MGNLVTVTLETDGHRDFVRLPTNERYTLGTMSVLRLVSALVPNRHMGRRAIEEFNRTGKAVVILDPEAMLELLAPRPVRRASAVSSLIPQSQWTPSTSMEGRIMSDLKRTLELRLSFIEHAIREMNTLVASGKPVKATAHKLHQAAVHLTDFGDQSKNDAFYGLGEPKVDTVEDVKWNPPPAVTHPVGKTAAALKANADLAEEILVKVAETSDKVAALEAAGRKFNASKAQSDLHKIAEAVSGVLSDADLAEGWVQNDLGKIAKEADRLHGIFASARV